MTAERRAGPAARRDRRPAVRRIAPLAALPFAVLPAAAQERNNAAPPTAPAPGPLMLSCDGLATNPVGDPARGRPARKTGGKKSRNRSDGDATDDDATPPATATPAGRGTPVTFRFEFAAGGGRVLYPAAIVPVVHSGGHGGWWPIGDLAVSDDAFSGRVTLNFINHARFTIDRHSGLFNLTGLQANVSGRCAKAAASPRLF